MALRVDGKALARTEAVQQGRVSLGMHRRWRVCPLRAVLLVVVILGAWLPRATAADRLVTPDEHLWFAWSAEFAESIGGEFFADEDQLVYPGVTLMWLSTVHHLITGPDSASEVIAQLDAEGSSMISEGQSRTMDWIALLERLRALVIAVNVALLAVAFLLATRLFDVEVAALGALLVAWDPFNVALTRLFQVDGLNGLFMLVSVLSALCFVYRGRRVIDLAASAVAGGLAMLTRSTSIFLVAFFALLVALAWWRERQGGRNRLDTRGAVRTIGLWCGVVLATCFGLWPALRADPLGTLAGTVEAGLGKAGAAHEWQTFFNGAVYQDNLEPHFYPVVLLWRSTPAVLIGLGLTAVLFALPRTRAMIRAEDRRVLLALLAFVVLFVAALTVSPKRFDRYLIPVMAPLGFVAAWGWIAAARQIVPVAGTAQRRRWVASLVAAAALAMQMATLAPSFPYYLSYYNPLFGGAPRAVDTMMIGWGEGFDQVAAYLNDLPDARTTTVLAGPWSTAFAYFHDGIALTAVYADRPPDPASRKTVRAGDPVLQWAKADYRLLYISEWQRKMLPESLLAYFAERSPVMTVTIQGLEYARLYDIRQEPLPEAFLVAGGTVSDWEGTIRLVETEFSARRVAAGGSVNATAYVQGLDRDEIASGRLKLVLKVVDDRGVAVAQADTTVRGPQPERTIWPIAVRVRLPDDLKPGRYHLELAFAHKKRETTLAWSHLGSERVVDAPFVVGSVVVPKPRADPRDPPLEMGG